VAVGDYCDLLNPGGVVLCDLDFRGYKVALDLKFVSDMGLEITMRAIEEPQTLEVLGKDVGIKGGALLP
jgi:hypothetical protein